MERLPLWTRSPSKKRIRISEKKRRCYAAGFEDGEGATSQRMEIVEKVKKQILLQNFRRRQPC